MSGRFALLVVMAVALSGCAGVSEERVALLESAVMDLQASEMRLASLEETVAGLVAENNRREGRAPQREAGEPAAVAHAGSRAAPPAPRRVEPASPEAAKPRAVSDKKNTSAQASRRYDTALKTLESGRPQAAMALFQDFLRDYPDHPLAPNAGYWLGECYYSLKQFDAAILAFKDVVAQHPTHEKAAAAMLKAGYSYDLLGDKANARFYLDALVKDFPGSQPASLARARLASL